MDFTTTFIKNNFKILIMNINKLEEIGLKEKEAKIYIELLKIGPSLANQLARKSNILRSSIYDYLDILLDKGFITYTIRSGKKYFQAVNPEKIRDNFQEKRQKEDDFLKKFISELSKIRDTGKEKTTVEIFEGKGGMKSAMSRILKDHPKEIMVYGSSGAGYKVLPFFLEHWHNERIKQKIEIKIIYNEIQEAKNRIKEGPSLKLSKIKLLPVRHSSITGTIIYGKKTLLTIWDTLTPIAISIESEEISKNYKDHFNILWKTAKRTKYKHF